MAGSSSIVGQTLGHYRILERIGAGGMGEVYRARDARLGRDVAVKILPPGFSRDEDRLRRFEQEARAAAALNHPNILAIFDIGMQDGSPYIVSELLEGETLRQRLLSGSLPVRLAADYALQIVRGLVAAHEKRIVHRDLKPENLFTTKDGRVKILDFGLAKLTQAEEVLSDSGSTTTLVSVTRPGEVMGTAGYMSPEQVRGKAVDHRGDIFSFGAIFYEMLAGKRLFSGETSADTMTAILREDPPELAGINPNVGPAVERVVRHCLEKNPEDRFQSTRDLAFDLSSLLEAPTTRTPVGVLSRTQRARKLMPWALVLAVLAAAIGLFLAGRHMKTASTPSYRRLTFQRGTIYSARFAPGEQTVLYGASWSGRPIQLFSIASDVLAPRPLSFNSVDLLAVSRSGELALAVNGILGAHRVFSRGTLARAPLAGGAPREILEDVRGADWDPEGQIAVVHHVQGRSRLEFPIGKVLYETSGWISHIRFSPKGDLIAFLDHPSEGDDRGSVCVVDLAGKVTTLSGGWESEDGLAWSAQGDEIWFTAVKSGYDRALLAVDRSGRQRTVLRVPGGLTLHDIAGDGRVLVAFESERLAMEGAGRTRNESRDLSWYDWTIAKDISRDGNWVLFEESSEPVGPHYAVGIRRMDDSPPVRLGEGSAGGLSPDGKWAIAIFTGTPERITLLPIGAGQPREIQVHGIEHFQNGGARFLPDGRRIVLNGAEPAHSLRSYVQDLGGGKPRPVTPEGVTANLPSPDGRYVAGLDADRRLTIYPIEGGQARRIPQIAPGYGPIAWGSDSMSLYVYHTTDQPAKIYRVDIATGKQQFLRELMPADPAGVITISPIVMTPDASTYLYSYSRILSVLYIVSGLK